MSVFLIVLKEPVDPEKASELREKCSMVFGQHNIKEICAGQILISSEKIFMPDGIAKDLGDEFSRGEFGSYLLVPVHAYWGFHDRTIWNWLLEKGI